MKQVIDKEGNKKIVGLQGSPGPAGPAGGSYKHIQNFPSSTWIVQHDLGYMPGGIYVEDSAGEIWYGVIDHIDNNNLTIDFDNISFSGFALFS